VCAGARRPPRCNDLPRAATYPGLVLTCKPIGVLPRAIATGGGKTTTKPAQVRLSSRSRLRLSSTLKKKIPAALLTWRGLALMLVADARLSRYPRNIARPLV
jgi:hypothetical protein